MKFPAWSFGLGRVGVGNRTLGRAEFVYVYFDAMYVTYEMTRSDGSSLVRYRVNESVTVDLRAIETGRNGRVFDYSAGPRPG